jgi:hypothetical protein
MNQDLINYIKVGQAQGMSREQITDELKKVGWQDAQINKAFRELQAPAQPAQLAKTNLYLKFNPRTLIVAGVVLGVLLIGGGVSAVLYIGIWNPGWNPFGQTVEQIQEEQQETTEDAYANWQTYRNEEFGFEFQYPSRYSQFSSQFGDVFCVQEPMEPGDFQNYCWSGWSVLYLDEGDFEEWQYITSEEYEDLLVPYGGTHEGLIVAGRTWLHIYDNEGHQPNRRSGFYTERPEGKIIVQLAELGSAENTEMLSSFRFIEPSEGLSFENWKIEQVINGEAADSSLILTHRVTRESRTLVSSTVALQERLANDAGLSSFEADNGSAYLLGSPHGGEEFYFSVVYEFGGSIFGMNITTRDVRKIEGVKDRIRTDIAPTGDKATRPKGVYPSQQLEFICFGSGRITIFASLFEGETLEERPSELDSYYSIEWIDDETVEYKIYEIVAETADEFFNSGMTNTYKRTASLGNLTCE